MKLSRTVFILSSMMLAFTSSISAQETIELKFNPIGTLFGNINVSGEYLVSDDFGAELTVGLLFGNYGSGEIDGIEAKRSGFGVMGMGKYYFSPEDGCDKFYVGAYLRQRSFSVEARNSDDSDEYAAFDRDIFAGGFALGYKWVGEKKISLELALGAGRAFSEKNEWSDPDNEGEAFPDLGVDFISRLAVGYRF
ncbi:MAG: DUF3575 domain-containing protein [Flavobacteriales bacterium]|nr:DUF3575 domain-containing protein [Flavobacteriales bacterium]